MYLILPLLKAVCSFFLKFISRFNNNQRKELSVLVRIWAFFLLPYALKNLWIFLPLHRFYVFPCFIALLLVHGVLSLEGTAQITKYKLSPHQICHPLLISTNITTIVMTSIKWSRKHLPECHPFSAVPKSSGSLLPTALLVFFQQLLLLAKAELFGGFLGQNKTVGGTNNWEQCHSYFPELLFFPYTH